MARQYTVTEYDKNDIEKLDFMTVGEVIETLKHRYKEFIEEKER